jgi:hypothetical protein
LKSRQVSVQRLVDMLNTLYPLPSGLAQRLFAAPSRRIQGMSEARRKGDWLVVAALVLAVVVVSLSLYVWGYIALGVLGTESTKYETKMCRFYSTQWQAYMFRPAARVESVLARREITTGHMPP